MNQTCALDLVYSLLPYEYFDKKLVADTRIKLGKDLANKIPTNIINKIDFITPCPNTGNYYAMGLAQQIKKDYLQVVIKNNEKRLFNIENIDLRKFALSSNLIFLKELIKKKKILLVDEAIFSGMTLKIVTDRLRFYGAEDVYIAIPTPPCVITCPFGKHKGRIALLEKISPDMLNVYFDSDGIYYQDFENFKKNIAISRNKDFCMNCFKGTLR